MPSHRSVRIVNQLASSVRRGFFLLLVAVSWNIHCAGNGCGSPKPSTTVTDLRQVDTAPSAPRPDLTSAPPPDLSADSDLHGTCPSFKEAQKLGTVEQDAITEASGLVASRRQLGLLWTHNDSGDSARVFALDQTGKARATFQLAAVQAIDWEDIALGPDAPGGQDHLYLADIGDNAQQRSSVTIYRFAEPLVPTAQEPVSVTIDAVEQLELRYPDGPHNAEAIIVDPSRADLIIITKSDDGVSPIYISAAPHDTRAQRTLSKVATLTFQQGLLNKALDRRATAADISSTGDEIIVRTYLDILLWPRKPSQTIAEALVSAPCRLPIALEPQGEAVAFAGDGHGYLTLSEEAHQPIYFFERR